MKKEFIYTPIICDKSKLINLFNETKYNKLDVYFKQNDNICHVIICECLESKKSDYEYTLNDKKFYTFDKFLEKINELINEDDLEILEIDNDSPHYHYVFSNDYIDVEREEIVKVYEGNMENNNESELIQTFSKPKHTWVILENLIYLAVIVFAIVYGLTSLLDYGADFFNIALIALAFIMSIYCFKDYFKYKLEVYNDKIIYPHIKVKDFSLAYKNVREIKYKDIRKVIYLNNPKAGKTTRELVVICENDAQRVISLNTMNKNQYIDVATCLIEQLDKYYKNNKE